MISAMQVGTILHLLFPRASAQQELHAEITCAFMQWPTPLCEAVADLAEFTASFLFLMPGIWEEEAAILLIHYKHSNNRPINFGHSFSMAAFDCYFYAAGKATK